LIIVVDAQEGLRWLYQHWLSADGYSVQEACDRAALQSLLTQVKPDLILLDLHLGGLEGIRTCQRLQADPDLEGVQIIGTTQEAGGLSIRLADSAGADAVLVKPFSRIELELSVQTCLERAAVPAQNKTREPGAPDIESALKNLTPKWEDGSC